MPPCYAYPPDTAVRLTLTVPGLTVMQVVLRWMNCALVRFHFNENGIVQCLPDAFTVHCCTKLSLAVPSRLLPAYAPVCLRCPS